MSANSSGEGVKFLFDVLPNKGDPNTGTLCTISRY